MRDKEEQERKARVREARDSQLITDYVETFTTPHGKRVLLDIFRNNFFFTTTYTGDNATFVSEGKRQSALNIMHNIMKREPTIIAEVLNMHEELKKMMNSIK